MEDIYLYDTMKNKEVKFEHEKNKLINFYTCGPTVYDYIHIGNARPYVFFDIARRYLKKVGYKVNFIVNITDIDDKIINKANKQDKSFKEIAEKYKKEFLKDLENLKVLKPDKLPTATETIPDMIKLIKKLEEKGYIYKTSDGVYFRVRKFEDYGRLSKKDIDELKSGARIAVNKEKEDPLDFALWKFSKPNEPSWESPWGKGRPGWHIECSAMGMKYTDGTLDFHAGGEDLIFPHHENEVAQSEAATGKTFVRYWLHNAYVNIDGMKMSKSLGNFKTVRELLKKYKPETIRLLLISTHYRKLLDFNDKTVENAQKKYERLNNFIHVLKDIEDEKNDFFEKYNKKIIDKMNNDFNTPGAIGVLFEAIKKVNKNKNNENYKKGIKALLQKWDDVFGIIPKHEAESGNSKEDELIDLLIKVRNKEKKNKNFEIADFIRDKLKELGIELQDTKKGTIYKKK